MSGHKPALSAIVIAKNESVRLAACLNALKFTDEVIVIDNASDDDTAAVARQNGASVYPFHTADFSKLRNEAMKLAKGTWLLYVDADETVSEVLAQHIVHVTGSPQSGKYAGYEIHRKNYYLGRAWPAGEWMLRLFRKDALSEWKGELHETPMVNGAIGRIDGDLLHDTHRSMTEMVAKTNEWSETEASLRLAIHHPPVVWWRIFRVMLTGFFRSFIGQGGWRAGTTGWIESIYQAFSMFITYAKLWELQQKKHPHV